MRRVGVCYTDLEQLLMIAIVEFCVDGNAALTFVDSEWNTPDDPFLKKILPSECMSIPKPTKP